MFIADSHQPQLLPPDAYYSEAQWEREREKLFLPAWHFVGMKSELAKEGDFFTRDLLGFPILIRNMEGGLHGFLNVCSHRFSKLTAQRCGHSAVLKCQYHGWEYDASGNTRRIPDAPNFRPMEKGQLCLTKFAVDTCGELVFVRVAENGPELSTFLGAVGELLREQFPENNYAVATIHRVVAANWKVILENNVESYHLDSIHGKTLGTMPTEEVCEHGLFPGHTTFRTIGGPFGKRRKWLDSILKKLALPSTKKYLHVLKYPNLVVSTLDGIVSLQVFLPITACTTEVSFFGFARQNLHGSRFQNWRLRRFIEREFSFWLRVLDEDFALFPTLQQGIMAKQLPVGGLLSRREERCSHFQKYVYEHCQDNATDGTTTKPNDPA